MNKVVPMRWVFLGVFTLAAVVVSQMGTRGTVSDRRPIMFVTDMDVQPRYDAQSAGPFFRDGRAMRTPPSGTVAFGGADYDSDAGSPRQNPDFLRDDDGYYRGKQGQAWLAQNPLKLDMAVLRRGQERYGIYCAPATARLARVRASWSSMAWSEWRASPMRCTV